VLNLGVPLLKPFEDFSDRPTQLLNRLFKLDTPALLTGATADLSHRQCFNGKTRR